MRFLLLLFAFTFSLSLTSNAQHVDIKKIRKRGAAYKRYTYYNAQGEITRKGSIKMISLYNGGCLQITGERHGVWKYYKNGKLLYKEWYDAGELIKTTNHPKT